MDQVRGLYESLLEKIARTHEQRIPFIERIDAQVIAAPFLFLEDFVFRHL